MNQQNIDYVLRSVEQRDIRFVRLWFVDILGRLKNFAISPEDLEVAFEEGIGFDGSAIEGFATPEEADMLAFPDASTFQILPWRPSHNGVARVFCDVCTPDRKPFAGDPRDALRRMFYKAEKAGYLLNVGAELEYYYFPDEHTPEPLDNVGYFDLSVSDAARDLRRNTVLTLEKMSVPVEYTFHAAGRSQHGMSLRHAEALSMSDASPRPNSSLSSRLTESGCHASFMPKPLAGEDGSAMFLCQSLFDHDGNNVFWGEDDEKYHLSDIAKHYMAGILAHAREISAITNPTVNSYKRITTAATPCRSTPRGACATARVWSAFRSTSPASSCPRASSFAAPTPWPTRTWSTPSRWRLVWTASSASWSSRPRQRLRRSSLPTVRWSRPATRRCLARSKRRSTCLRTRSL